MTIVSSLPFTLTNGQTADATQVMADFNQIVNGVNANAAANGANSDITALLGLSAPFPPSEGGSATYYGTTVAGSANAITIGTTLPAGFLLTAGLRLHFAAANDNTGATTANILGTGATAIVKRTPAGLEPLIGGEIVAGSVYTLEFDGTDLELLDGPGWQDFGPLETLASATTTDLGTAGSRNIDITGTTTITGFGSSAVVGAPVYQLYFSGAMLLTYNATSLVLPTAANITTAAGDTAQALYGGAGNWIIFNYQRFSGQPLAAVAAVGSAQAIALKVTNNSGTPNTKISVSARVAVMVTSAGAPIFATSVSATIDCTTTGANGLDAGSLGDSTWYAVFLISNGTTTAGLASLSSTAPTMPAGYTYAFFAGWMITDSSAHFMRTLQLGRKAQYAIQASGNTTAYPTAASGALGTITATAFTGSSTSLAGLVPLTAGEIQVLLSNAGIGGAFAVAAPNLNFAGLTEVTAPPLTVSSQSGTYVNSTTTNGSMVLENPTATTAPGVIYYASNNAAGLLQIVGWEDYAVAA